MIVCQGACHVNEPFDARAPAFPRLVRHPHVDAPDESSAWWGLGYACAQDRVFQLDYDRRRACGRLAEVLGPAVLDGDVLARKLDLARSAQADLDAMSPGTRSSFDAYAEGVNAAWERLLTFSWERGSTSSPGQCCWLEAARR